MRLGIGAILSVAAFLPRALWATLRGPPLLDTMLLLFRLVSRSFPVVSIVTFFAGAMLTVQAVRGPKVKLAPIDGLPADRRDDLVPIEREAAVDEDLLEDSTNRIEDYLRQEGYRDVTAPFTRAQTGDNLLITFTVTKGPLYYVSRLQVSGSATIPPETLAAMMRTREGQPFSDSRLRADVASLEA